MVKKVSIIIVNWKNLEDSINCIESILDLQGVKFFDIYFVDNNSEDKTPEKISKFILKKGFTSLNDRKKISSRDATIESFSYKQIEQDINFFLSLQMQI